MKLRDLVELDRYPELQPSRELGPRMVWVLVRVLRTGPDVPVFTVIRDQDEAVRLGNLAYVEDTG